MHADSTDRQLKDASCAFYRARHASSKIGSGRQEAEAWLEMAERLYGSDDVRLAEPLMAIAQTMWPTEERPIALLLRAETLLASEPGHEQRRRDVLQRLRMLYAKEGMQDERIDRARQIAEFDELHAEDEVDVLAARRFLAREICCAGRYAEGVALLESVVSGLEALEPENDDMRTKAEGQLADTLSLLVSASVATGDVRREVELRERLLSCDWPRFSSRLSKSGEHGWAELATARFVAGDLQGAVEAERRSIEEQGRSDGFWPNMDAMAEKARHRAASVRLELLEYACRQEGS